MLSALLEDFGRIPGVEVETMLFGETTGRTPPAGVVVHPVEYSTEEAAFSPAWPPQPDWTLVVAPEIDGILPSTLQWIEEAQGRSLGATPAAGRLTSDKLRLADHLREQGRAHAADRAVAGCRIPSFPAVCKAVRCSAGSQAAFLVRNDDELRRAVEETRPEWNEIIIQPYIPGQAASVAFLIGPGMHDWRCPPRLSISRRTDGLITRAAVCRSRRTWRNERRAWRAAPLMQSRDCAAMWAWIWSWDRRPTATP